MLTAEDYQFAWLLYILASFGALAVFWRILPKQRLGVLKPLLCLSLGSVLLTPIEADVDQAYLAPAFLVCSLETIFEGTEASARSGVPILVTWMAVMLLALLAIIAQRLYGRRKNVQDHQFDTSAEEEADHQALLQESEALPNR